MTRLGELHEDAAALHRHRLAPDPGLRRRATSDDLAASTVAECSEPHDPAPGNTRPDQVAVSGSDASRRTLFSADVGVRPLPSGTVCEQPLWARRLARAMRAVVGPGLRLRRSTRAPADIAGEPRVPSRRQPNPAPWLAAGLIGIVLLALGTGLVSHLRVAAEAAQMVDARRRAAEQALTLLHASNDARRATAAPASDAALHATPEATPDSDVRARHDAMLASIKAGRVLASLPPSALAQPTPLPAPLPPVAGTSAASARGVPSAPSRPPKKIGLVVEGSPDPVARGGRAADPLAAAAVRSSLKGAIVPRHRVYQLRELDGEWLGFVAPTDADPVAAGLWAGSGDLLAGGWRVAEVTSLHMTLVGYGGALEILRP